MDLCVLPQTGASEQWLVLVVVAAIVIGAGIALAVSGKARRRVATGLGALAIVGALALGGMQAAPAALADAGSACVTAPGGAQAPRADTVVTPGIPGLQQQCNAESTVVTPTTTGVTYTQTRDGSVVTVTAAANAGYRILDGSTTTWYYDVSPVTPAPAPIDLPTTVRADLVDTAPTPEGGTEDRFETESTFMPDLLAAAAAGSASYGLDATQAELVVEFDLLDLEGQPLTFAASAPVANAIFGYDAPLALFTLAAPVEDRDAAFASLLDQLDAFQQENPGAQLIGVRQAAEGLAVGVQWDGGSVCGQQAAYVAIDAVYLEITGVPGEPGPAGLATAASASSGVTSLADVGARLAAAAAAEEVDATLVETTAPIADDDSASIAKGPAAEQPTPEVPAQSPAPEVEELVEG